MSNSLYYLPIVPTEGIVLPDELKRILNRKFNLFDGAENLGHEDIDYLLGLYDAGVPGALELIDAIKGSPNGVKIFLQG